MSIGTKIQRVRELKGLTQEELADRLGMSAAGLGKLERGDSDIPYSRLEQISKVLGMRTEDLICFDEKYVFYNYASANQGHNIIHQTMNDNERKLYEENIKLLQEKITYLEENIKQLKEGK